MKKIIYILLGIVGLATLFFQFIYIPKTTYETSTIKRGDFDKDVFAIGTLSSEIIYQISSNTTGKILNIFVKEGQNVKKGQLLATIDGIDLKDKLKEEEYSISKAISNQEISNNKIEEAKAKYDIASSLSKRYEKLFEGGFVSQLEFDNIKLSEISAKATLNSLKNDQIALTNEIQRLRYSQNGIKEKVQNLELKAPEDGIVVQKEVEIGDTAPAAKVLFKIVNPKNIWIKAFIDESISGNININQKASISLRSKPDEKFDGFVKNIDFISDNVTEERELGIAFNKVLKQFFLNEQAEVKIIVKTYKNTLLCEWKNIIKQDKQNGLWIYKNGIASFVPIKILAKSTSSNFVVVEGNINENDIVIVPNENKKTLKNGASVKI